MRCKTSKYSFKKKLEKSLFSFWGDMPQICFVLFFYKIVSTFYLIIRQLLYLFIYLYSCLFLREANQTSGKKNILKSLKMY